VMDLMAEIQANEGVAFLFISHDLAVVERVSHRIAVMRAGSIVEMGPTQAVLSNPAHEYTRSLLAAVPSPDPFRRRAPTQLPAMDAPRAGQVLSAGRAPSVARMAEISENHFVAVDSEMEFRFAAALAGESTAKRAESPRSSALPAGLESEDATGRR